MVSENVWCIQNEKTSDRLVQSSNEFDKPQKKTLENYQDAIHNRIYKCFLRLPNI